MGYSGHQHPKNTSSDGIQLTRAEATVLKDLVRWHMKENDLDIATKADLELLIKEIEDEYALIDTKPAVDHLPNNILSRYADELEQATHNLEDSEQIFDFYDTVFHGLAEKINKE